MSIGAHTDRPRVEGRTVAFTSQVNGRPVDVACAAADTLADVLRTQLGLTGTKVSCESQVCGACTVLLDGAPVSACTVLALEARGRQVTTVEGLADEHGRLSPLQEAFWEENAFQCGFCTPGMLIAATALLREDPTPDTAAIRHWMDGNLCRCTGYAPIVRAIQRAAAVVERDGRTG